MKQTYVHTYVFICTYIYIYVGYIGMLDYTNIHLRGHVRALHLV